MYLKELRCQNLHDGLQVVSVWKPLGHAWQVAEGEHSLVDDIAIAIVGLARAHVGVDGLEESGSSLLQQYQKGESLLTYTHVCRKTC